MTVVNHPLIVEPVETKLVRLGDLFRVESGGTPSRREASNFAGTIPWVKISDMLQGTIQNTDECISDLALTNSAAKLWPKGTLLVSIFATIGRTAILGLPATSNQAIAGLIPLSNETHISYIRHFIDSHVTQLTANSRGLAQNNINLAILRAVQLPIPPLTEQRRIAAILDKADHLRTQRREAIAHLDALTQSIFNDMFGDPVSNSSNWPTAKLSTLGKLDRGVSKHRPRNDPRLLNGTHPLIQTGDVANSGGYITRFKTTYSDLGLAQSKMWPIGTLCITIAANIAKTGILTFEACFPDSVVGFKADESTAVFVQVWMGFLQKIIENNAPESAQKNINLAILRDLDVIDPPLELQQTFARRVAGVERLKEQHRTHLAELDTLFASLQYRAFRGEL